jgi:hypothetical protein
MCVVSIWGIVESKGGRMLPIGFVRVAGDAAVPGCRGVLARKPVRHGRRVSGVRRSGVAGLFVVTLVIASCAALAVVPAPRADTARPLVTVIGDSVMTGVIWHEDALSILAEGIDLQIDVAVCRRLTGESCPYEGARPPNLLDVVHAYGLRLGGTVVVVAGYNEPELLFSQAVADSLAALREAGVTRILWATLAEATPAYAVMNNGLAAIAAEHPELTLVDWNDASRDHPGWFQTDRIHLTPEGGVAMATLLRSALDGGEPEAPVPPVATASPLLIPAVQLPPARVGRRYSVRIVATGGTTPYRWSVKSGSMPKGLRLGSGGWVSGIPTAPARARPVLRVGDADGLVSTRRVLLVVAA